MSERQAVQILGDAQFVKRVAGLVERAEEAGVEEVFVDAGGDAGVVDAE